MNIQREPLISVIMPTYNHANFVGGAVSSVLLQTYFNLELIIIDNYSTDNTEEVIKGFNDDRIRYYKFSNNGVIAASRNKGIKEARGEYIAFIDSDDKWVTGKLVFQKDCIEKKPETGLLCCDFTIKSFEKRHKDRLMIGARKDIVGTYSDLINFNFVICSSVFVKKSILDNIGLFDENKELLSVEDWDLWLRISREHTILFKPEVLGMYRLHDSNTTDIKKRLEKMMCVVKKHTELGWISNKKQKELFSSYCFRNGWFYSDKDSKLSRHFFLRAIKSSGLLSKSRYLSIVGLFLSFVPFICKYIRENSIDKRVKRIILGVD